MIASLATLLGLLGGRKFDLMFSVDNLVPTV